MVVFFVFFFFTFSHSLPDIGDQYQTEYQKAFNTCGNTTSYINVNSYENLITIKDDVLKIITSCESTTNLGE